MGQRYYKTWYRALLPDGSLYCETSDLRELRNTRGDRLDLNYERDVLYVTSEGYQSFDPWEDIQ